LPPAADSATRPATPEVTPPVSLDLVEAHLALGEADRAAVLLEQAITVLDHSGAERAAAEAELLLIRAQEDRP
jgi:hypothetical protein